MRSFLQTCKRIISPKQALLLDKNFQLESEIEEKNKTIALLNEEIANLQKKNSDIQTTSNNFFGMWSRSSDEVHAQRSQMEETKKSSEAIKEKHRWNKLEDLKPKNLGEVLLFKFITGTGFEYFRLGGYGGDIKEDKHIELFFGGQTNKHYYHKDKNASWIDPRDLLS